MDREAFFARATRPQTTEIQLSEDLTVKARKLTQAEVEHIRKTYATEDKALVGFRYIVSRCVLNDADERMFTDEDLGKLATLDFDTIEGIALGVMKFSGMRVDAKNG
jgi:hypothetical protein